MYLIFVYYVNNARKCIHHFPISIDSFQTGALYHVQNTKHALLVYVKQYPFKSFCGVLCLKLQVNKYFIAERQSTRLIIMQQGSCIGASVCNITLGNAEL